MIIFNVPVAVVVLVVPVAVTSVVVFGIVIEAVSVSRLLVPIV
jgi:hypothetical protein